MSAEKDRRIEAEAADRLQGRFGRQIGIVAEDQELGEAVLGADRAIFGQIAAGLPHQPDGGVFCAAPPSAARKGFGLLASFDGAAAVMGLSRVKSGAARGRPCERSDGPH